jgi:sec-independent protein translocase protein TatA
MFENVGGGEILLILLVVLVFFGPKKIPELAASLGKGLRKFNDAKSNIEGQVKTAMKEPLDALTGAKAGFEAKLREVAEPLHAELRIPSSLSQPVAPAMPLPQATYARGASLEPEEPIATPPTPSSVIASPPTPEVTGATSEAPHTVPPPSTPST